MKQATLRHRLEFLLYRVGVGVFRWAPERWALLAGEGLGWFVGVVLRVRRRTVDSQLNRAFPEKNQGWRRRVARASFRHLGREAAATFRLARMDAEEIRERTEVVGFEALEKAVGEGRGVIVVTGHFGNWEVGGAYIAARGIALDVVVQRQRNPLFDKDLNRHRSKLGMRVIDRREAPKQVLKALRAGRVVAIVADQNVRHGGLFVDFFGREAATARGAAVFALRTGVPVFLGIARRKTGFPQSYLGTVEPVTFTSSGETEEDVRRLTEAHTKQLEDHVRAAPAQYFWQHRRWKTRPSWETSRTAQERGGQRGLKEG